MEPLGRRVMDPLPQPSKSNETWSRISTKSWKELQHLKAKAIQRHGAHPSKSEVKVIKLLYCFGPCDGRIR